MGRKQNPNSLGRQINRNTTRLPQALVQELQERGDLKQNFDKKARKPPQSKRPRKSVEKDVPADAPPSKKRKKETPLEKLANAGSSTSTKKSKPLFLNPIEDQEAKEIAWLEAQLGLGPSKQAKKSKEWDEDGLDELFGDLGRIESKLGLESKPEPFQKTELSDSEDDELELEDFDTDISSSEGSGVEEAEATDSEAKEPVPVASSGKPESSTASKKVHLDSDSSPEDSSSKPEMSASAKPAAYVPPHLRKQAGDDEAAARLERILSGYLNKLSPLNMATILAAIEECFTQNARAVVSQSLVKLIIERVAHSSDVLGEVQVVTLAALTASLFGNGIHIREGVVTESLKRWDRYSSNPSEQAGKEKTNIVRLWSRLYNFDVVSCQFVYSLIKELIGPESSDLGEDEVEQLMICLKCSGPKLRSDDPSSLKQIVGLVEAKKRTMDVSSMSSRTKFMVETLGNLKNNRIKQEASQTGPGSVLATEEGLRKHLTAVGRRRSVGLPEPFQFSLDELRASSKDGKWWAVGAAWSGNPLAEKSAAKALDLSKPKRDDAVWLKLAHKQGMNTEVRKAIFVALMGAEDYVDAWERLQQLSLKEVQRRETVRVILHCLGNEKRYNPFYTLVMQHMLSQPSGVSHSFAVTVQYALWDFFRELGETEVGGHKRLETATSSVSGSVSGQRMSNLARAFAWWIAKDGLSITVLKPLPFGTLLPQSNAFVSQLLTDTIVSLHCASPLLNTKTKLNAKRIEGVFTKAATHKQLTKGLTYFLEAQLEGDVQDAFVKEGLAMALDAVKLGQTVAQDVEAFL